jgi:hypothetical protein
VLREKPVPVPIWPPQIPHLFTPESNPTLRCVKYATNRLSWPFSSHNYANQHRFASESFDACLRCEAVQMYLIQVMQPRYTSGVAQRVPGS